MFNTNSIYIGCRNYHMSISKYILSISYSIDICISISCLIATILSCIGILKYEK
jgi:hypothetical protein